VFTFSEYNAEWRTKAAFQALWDSLLIVTRYGELVQELQARFLTALLITENTFLHSKLDETFEVKHQTKIRVALDLSRRSPGKFYRTGEQNGNQADFSYSAAVFLYLSSFQ
jgi:hypothetical protein